MSTNSTCSTCPYQNEFGYCSLTACVSRNITLQPEAMVLKDPDCIKVTRCKDCKHLFDGEQTENCCDVLMEKTGWMHEISVSPDWYCADGERR